MRDMWNGLQGKTPKWQAQSFCFVGPPNSAILSSAAFAQFSISVKTCLLSAFIISATILGFNHSIVLLLYHSLCLLSLWLCTIIRNKNQV